MNTLEKINRLAALVGRGLERSRFVDWEHSQKVRGIMSRASRAAQGGYYGEPDGLLPFGVYDTTTWSHPESARGAEIFGGFLPYCVMPDLSYCAFETPYLVAAREKLALKALSQLMELYCRDEYMAEIESALAAVGVDVAEVRECKETGLSVPLQCLHGKTVDGRDESPIDVWRYADELGNYSCLDWPRALRGYLAPENTVSLLCDGCATTKPFYDESCTRCAGCRGRYIREDLHYDEDRDEYRCDSCENDDEEESERDSEGLYGYSTNPLRELGCKFLHAQSEKTDERTLYLGVELEVLGHKAKEDEQLYPTVQAVHRALSGMALCKEDGSLPNYGFEIVSLPATLKFHQQTLWKKFFDDGTAATLRGWHQKACGMHVHLSHSAFEGKFHIARFTRLLTGNHNRDFMVRVAGRDFFNNDFCCGRPTVLKAALKNENYSRYSAVNLSTGKDTVEVRIFQSNTAPLGFFKNIEFCHAAHAYTAQCGVSDRETDYERFVQFVWKHRATYRALAAWLIRQGYLKAIRGSGGREATIGKLAPERLVMAAYSKGTFANTESAAAA